MFLYFVLGKAVLIVFVRNYFEFFHFPYFFVAYEPDSRFTQNNNQIIAFKFKFICKYQNNLYSKMQLIVKPEMSLIEPNMPTTVLETPSNGIEF